MITGLTCKSFFKNISCLCHAHNETSMVPFFVGNHVNPRPHFSDLLKNLYTSFLSCSFPSPLLSHPFLFETLTCFPFIDICVYCFILPFPIGLSALS